MNQETTAKKLTPEDLEILWSNRAPGNDSVRNALIKNYLWLVKRVAYHLKTKLPEEVEVDDLVSAGIFGLIDAITAFDPARGVKFETYAAPRIRGSILDEIRSMDWVPRLVRSRAHKLTEAAQALEADLGRRPETRELAKKMRLSVREFEKIDCDAHATGIVSLSRKWFETDSQKDVSEIDVLADRTSPNPAKEAQLRDLKELIIRGLGRAERLIVVLYYFEEMTMKEIGESIGLSESRVSQIHSSILIRLRQVLEGRIGMNDKMSERDSAEGIIKTPVIAKQRKRKRARPKRKARNKKPISRIACELISELCKMEPKEGLKLLSKINQIARKYVKISAEIKATQGEIKAL